MPHHVDHWLAGDWAVIGTHIPHWAVALAAVVVVALLVAWFERPKRASAHSSLKSYPDASRLAAD